MSDPNSEINQAQNNINISMSDPRTDIFSDGVWYEGSGGYTTKRIDKSDSFGKNVQDPSQGEANVKSVGPPSIMTPNLFYEDGSSSGHGYTITTLFGRGSTMDRIGVENKLLRDNGERAWYDIDNYAKEPTTSNIIRWSEENNKLKNKPYKFTDFVFCKYWNKIPNNHMITLRRYAYPVWDNMDFPGQYSEDKQFYSPIAQAITYMGNETGNEISTLFSFEAGMKWEDLKASVHTVDQEQPGSSNSPMPKLASMLGILTGEANFNTISNGGNKPPDPYNDGPYMNRVMGPVNRIDSVKHRDAGLNYKQTFSLTFEYVARPINGVNTKAAMLDIIANILLLTYAEASFWGGDHRFTAGRAQYPFLGGQKGMRALYSGDTGGYMSAITSQISNAASEFGSFLKALSGDPIQALTSLGAGLMDLGLAKSLSKKKVQLAGLPALLSGSPVGEWHMMIGNPFNPMMMVGNLICTGVKFSFGNELGPDDFPLDMKVVIELDHGMPRDKSAIEAMFNRGYGKIYSLPDDIKNALDGTSAGQNAPKTQFTKNVSIDGSSKGGQTIQNKTILKGDPNKLKDTANEIKKIPSAVAKAFNWNVN